MEPSSLTSKLWRLISGKSQFLHPTWQQGTVPHTSFRATPSNLVTQFSSEKTKERRNHGREVVNKFRVGYMFSRFTQCRAMTHGRTYNRHIARQWESAQCVESSSKIFCSIIFYHYYYYGYLANIRRRWPSSCLPQQIHISLSFVAKFVLNI